MMEVISHIKETGLGAHILDGPTGPIGKVKAGAISIALATDAVIVPFYVSADRAWYFNSWDRFCIPKRLLFGVSLGFVFTTKSKNRNQCKYG